MNSNGNIAGIDPGQASGAIAIFSPEGKLLSVGDLPTQKVVKGKTIRTLLDGHELRKFLLAQNIGYVVIEKVHTMPKQGVASQGAFMEAFGLIKGILIGMGIPFTPIPPETWKKALLNGYGHEKGSAVCRVKNEYPGVVLRGDRCRVDNHNWADAVCLGEFFFRHGSNPITAKSSVVKKTQITEGNHEDDNYQCAVGCGL